MARTDRDYKFLYGATTDEFSIKTTAINRRKAETAFIRETPNGSRYKQVFGTGKVSWTFTFSFGSTTLLNTFLDAYNASVDGDELTLQEDDGAGSFDSFNVIINLPDYNADTVEADPVVKDLSIEVLEA